MSDPLGNWEDGRPVVFTGFEASGELGIWEDGAPVVREDTAAGGIMVPRLAVNRMTFGRLTG